jgi:PAS domain S-box-containing protein
VSLLIALGQNIVLVFALTYIDGLLRLSKRLERWSKNCWVDGLLYGIFGVLSMASAIEVFPGFIMDARGVVILVAGATKGPLVATLAGCMMVIYRFILGGAGAFPSGIGMAAAVCIGSGFYFLDRANRLKHRSAAFLILGTLGVINSLVWAFLLGGPGGLTYVQKAALPLLVFYPVATLLLEKLLSYHQHNIQTSGALLESEARYRAVLDAMDEGVLYASADGSILGVNATAERMLGHTLEQIRGNMPLALNWSGYREDGSILPGAEHPSVIALRTGQPQSNVVLGFDHPTEGRRWLSVSSRPLFNDGSSKPYAVVATLSDITERKLAMEQVERERDLLRTLIDSIPDYIFIKDAGARFVNSNAAHNRISGVARAEELIGKTAFDVFPLHLAAQFHADDMTVIQSGQALVNVERTSVDKDGHERRMLTTKVPLRNRDGKVIGLVGISRDITERELVERQKLELATEHQRVMLLHRFIGDLSHDFRTPLSVIGTSTYLAGKATTPEMRHKHLERIEEQTLHIRHLLDDLLEMSALEREDVIYHFEEVNLVDVVQDEMQHVATLVAERRQTLTFCTSLREACVIADERHIKRAIANLLENAVHYTPDGGRIAITIEARGKEHAIQIADNGIGITQEDQRHVFEHFYRADQARSVDTGGSGLGLPITRKIVEGHKGRVHMESEHGKGSTFTIVLPACDTTAQLAS